MTTLPRNIQVLAAHLEDVLEMWEQRDPGHWHPQMARAAWKAAVLTNALSSSFANLRDLIHQQYDEYHSPEKPVDPELRELLDAMRSIGEAQATIRDIAMSKLAQPTSHEDESSAS